MNPQTHFGSCKSARGEGGRAERGGGGGGVNVNVNVLYLYGPLKHPFGEPECFTTDNE